MIRTLVQSAFRTGCLSVASEGLIRQVLEMKGYQPSDIEALTALYEAVNAGKIQREARGESAIAIESRRSLLAAENIAGELSLTQSPTSKA